MEEADRNPYAAGVVALALAFHRTPVQHAELRHGRMPLPGGVIALLKLAGGSAPDPVSAALGPPDELRAAARFFIEQVLFRHGGSHYRVLGLDPGASIEQIKEHHRLLMRMFHPDRERHADDWKDAFATRINLAYSTLHDPETRRRYDATLPPPRPHRAPSRRRRTAVLGVPAAPRKRGLPPILRRHLPQWVLAGTALIALGIVGAVYVGNPRLPDPLQPAPLLATGTAHPDTAADAAAGAEIIAVAPIPEPPAAQAPLDAAPVAEPLEAPPVEPAPVAAPLESSRPATPLEPPRVAAPQPPRPPETRLAKPAAGPEQAPARVALPAAPAATTVEPEPPAAARPLPLDPNATLARFVSTYERGDTAAFMALFDEVAVGNAGGKPQIHREHELLFQTTDLRHIAIDGMAWAKEGDWMRGEGRYRATRMRKGEQRLQTETGIIRIQLLRRGNQALITGLDYQPGGRS
jgi:hypothetical protein